MLLASVMFQIAVAATSKNSWLSKANMPSIREGLTVTEVAGKTYVIDGYGIVGGVFVGDTNINETYNTIPDIWITGAPMLTARPSYTSTITSKGGDNYE